MNQLHTWIEHFEYLGIVRWPMLVAALLLLLQIAQVATQRRRQRARYPAMNRHAILAWGLLNALLGLLGTALGLAVTARSVERVGHLETDLLGFGARLSLTPALVGCSLFALSVLAWLMFGHLRVAGSNDSG